MRQWLFQTTKIQTFESNSQHIVDKSEVAVWLFQTTKIQTFESNSQLICRLLNSYVCCFRLRKYKILKAIHNYCRVLSPPAYVVSDYENTKFWKQFTTRRFSRSLFISLFQTTKIQTFESNSQPFVRIHWAGMVISDYKDTNFLKAIHNCPDSTKSVSPVVSDYEDTNFWKQFTTTRQTINLHS